MTDYTEQIEFKYDWQSVKSEQLDMAIDQAFDIASNLFSEEITDQGIVGMTFVGTVFTLTPSGKYYTPFACSNVEPCPECDGDGHRRKVCKRCDYRDPETGERDCTACFSVRSDNPPIMHKCKVCKGTGKRTIGELARSRNETPEVTLAFLVSRGSIITKANGETFFDCWNCQGAGKVYVDCPTCGGLGSAEAYQDSLWQEALEQVLDGHGMWSQSGEGDPCDVFFCRWVGWEEIFSRLLEKHIESVSDWLHDKATIRNVKDMSQTCKRFVSLYKRTIYG